MSGRSLATGACLLAGLLGGAACADRSTSTPSTPTAPTSPGVAVCAYTPDAPVAAVDAVGGTAAASVRTASACRWTAGTGSSADAWIVIDSQGTRVGPGTVAFTLQPNRSFTGRSGTVVIRMETGDVLASYAVSQRGAGCLYSVSPTAERLDWLGTYDGAGDSPRPVAVHAEPASCQWTATPSVPWIRLVYETPRGTGDKTIYVSVTESNQSTQAQVGEVVVAGLSGVNPDAHLVVRQAGR